MLVNNHSHGRMPTNKRNGLQAGFQGREKEGGGFMIYDELSIIHLITV